LLSLAPDNARILALMGEVEHRLGALLPAERHLERALDLTPGFVGARNLLAETQMRGGQSDKALATLEPLLQPSRRDPTALALAAEVYLQRGDTAKAEAFLTEASKANPDNAKLQAALALTQISKGDANAGFAQLESLSSRDPGTVADLAMITARLQRNELDAALAAVDKLQSKQPNQPLPYMLRSRILVLRKDMAGARASLEKAVAADPVYFPAVSALAQLDFAENKPEAALKRFESVLERQPENYRALVGVVQLRRRLGAPPQEIASLLSRGVSLHPAEVAPRLLLIEHYLAQNDAQAAQQAAREAVAAIPGDGQLEAALGRALLASNDSVAAIAAFNRAASAQPGNVLPQLLLADAYMRQGTYGAAQQRFQKALEIEPKSLIAREGLVKVALAQKRVNDAIKVAQEVQKERPNDAAGYLMEADIHKQLRHWDPAISSFQAALQRRGSVETAIQLHALYSTTGRTVEADRFAAKWMADKPRDARFMAHLASMALDKSDFAGAEAKYRQILAVQPNDAIALNNLASVLVQQGKSGALEFAQRAQQLLPDQPPIMDTLASALAAANQLSKAIEWQQKAVQKAPTTPVYRLNLAKLHLKAGDRGAARADLDALAKLSPSPSVKAESESLQKAL
jgi:putative PEP-CTERM system TPR-repeat lipoprotein